MSDRYGIEQEQVARLLCGSLKPEEIAGDPATQHLRVRELLRWFARPQEHQGNPKWLRAHACELAYYIATGGNLQAIDIGALREQAFKEGFNVSVTDRATLERIGFGKEPQP